MSRIATKTERIERNLKKYFKIKSKCKVVLAELLEAFYSGNKTLHARLVKKEDRLNRKEISIAKEVGRYADICPLRTPLSCFECTGYYETYERKLRHRTRIYCRQVKPSDDSIKCIIKRVLDKEYDFDLIDNKENDNG